MIDHLPVHDVPMLVSAVNTLLRDREFDDLDDICGYYEVERGVIDSLLSTHGFCYSAEYNKILAL